MMTSSLTSRDCDTIRECIVSVLRDVLTRQDAAFISAKAPTPATLVFDAVHAVLSLARDTTARFAEGWNARHCDPVRRLPVELSTSCFRLLDLRGRLAVSHVSRAWRRIALADPGMWATATITEQTRGVSQELLAELLRRSRPIGFEIAWKSYAAIPNDAVDVVIDNIARISSLKLRAPSNALLLRLFQQSPPLLERLECPQGDCTLPATWGSSSAPALKTLHIGQFSIPRDYQPLSTLHSFTGVLANASINASQLFDLYPALVSLTLHNVTQPALSHLRSLPDTLVDLSLFAGSFTKLDFSELQESWLGRRFRSLQLSYASALVPSIQLLTHGLYPALVSLTLHNVTQPALSHLRSLPDTLVDLSLFAGSFTKLDFSELQESWLGRRFRSLQLSYASALVPSIQLLTHGLSDGETWSMSVHDEILAVKLSRDAPASEERYQVNFYDNVLARDAASGALLPYLTKLSSLTTPMSTLLRFVSAPPEMLALTHLALVLNRETQLRPERAGPFRAPQLREVAFTVHRDLAAYCSLLEAQYQVLAELVPEALPRLFAYARPRLARVSVVGEQVEKLLARDLCSLQGLADELVVRDRDTGACTVFVNNAVKTSVV